MSNVRSLIFLLFLLRFVFLYRKGSDTSVFLLKILIRKKDEVSKRPTTSIIRGKGYAPQHVLYL